MKTRKIVTIVSIVGIVIAVGFGAVAIAASRHRDSEKGFGGWMGRHGDMPQMMMGHLKEQLKLTDEQETKMLPILKDAMEKHQALMQKFQEQTQQDWQAAATERQTLWQETKKQLEPILTPEQMQELDKMYANFAERGQKMGPGAGRMMFMHGKGKGELPQLLKDLNLTDDQRKQIFDIFSKYWEGHKEVVDNFLGVQKDFSNMILTEDFNEAKVRDMYKQSTAKFEDFVVSRAKMLAEMKAVLTPEQLKLLQDKVPQLLDELQKRIETGHSFMNTWMKFHGKSK